MTRGRLRFSALALALLSLLATACDDDTLLPTKASEHAQELSDKSRQLERMLERLPAVAHAHLQLSVPVVPAFAQSLPQASSASVLLEQRAGDAPVDEAKVRQLVVGAVPGLSTAAVTIVQTAALPPARPVPKLAQVGPFTVTAASASPLRVTLIIALGVQTLLAAALLWLLERARRAARRAPPNG